MIRIGEAAAKSIVNAPIESVNLCECMFTISSEEYAACAEGHQSAAQGRLASGKRFSVNPEIVGGTFMVLFAAVFGGGIAFMYLVASTSLADLLGLGAVDVGFGTAIPTLILTYVAMTFALSKAMRARKSTAPPAHT